MASKLYDCDLFNIARSSIDVTKYAILDFFKFLKLCPYDLNENT